MSVAIRDGDPIYYKYTVTKKNKETLIFIHGVGFDHQSWETFIPLFSNHFNLLRYDLRGHGSSARGNKDISWETFYEDLLFLVQTLNIQSFHLIGHGFGCNIAAKFALINPDIVVKSLILLSFAAVYPKTAAEKLGEIRKIQYKKESMESVGEQVLEFATTLPKQSEQFKKLLASYSKVSVETYFKIYQLMMQSKSAEYLQHIHIPSLILAGEIDPIYPTFLSSISALFLPKCHFLVVPKASNMMHIDQPELTIQWIYDFILDLNHRKVTQTGRYDEFFNELRLMFQVIFQEGERKVNSANELKINLLGPFHVYVNGEEILEGWNQRNAKQILVYLAFHKTVTREQLCDELWPEMPLKKSRNNLRVYLSHLKKILDYDRNKSNFLVMDHEHINLQGRVKCDLLDFFEEVDKVMEEELIQKSILAQKVLNKAPRKILNGFYEDWILVLREKLEGKLFELAQWVGDFYVDQNQNAKALEYYKLANQYHPDDFINEYRITKLQQEISPRKNNQPFNSSL